MLRTIYVMTCQAATNTVMLTAVAPREGTDLRKPIRGAFLIGNAPELKVAKTIWRSAVTDSPARVPGGYNPQPPIHPKLTYVERFIKAKSILPITSQSTQFHKDRTNASPIKVPLPTKTNVYVMTWTFEGIREAAEYDSILFYCWQKGVSILCAQEFKSESSLTFVKNRWDILLSGLPNEKYHGVGFFLSPQMRLHITDFMPHSPRMREITLLTLPYKITLLNVYVPSMVEDP